ncbi:nucleoside 2-deoxyribosyltransferase [Bordetella sp. BOR01]|uniref:nucleoside 2-deoxyribosyltransferase n=1 Tax=Bordetella sp. BOR01 TaxID=2854779 RepID=UPI001C49789C|nr:nucleoside 2-deoxyribosyltransferase [Bordetella sp. BOR01]MBV7485109.1 nucleoside 2-deoxyribosyltransferase [Bordetella sp. BOR01]
MKRIYLAGFDVFRADSLAHGEWLKLQCQSHGFTGLYPLDSQAPAGLPARALAQWIYEANTALIRASDAVLANLNAFRGAEPDSGTAFEVGYAVALGKPVWAYVDHADTLVQRLAVAQADDPPRHVDAQGHTVEDFGLNLNLMLACSATVVVGDAAQCLGRMAQALRD